MTNQAWQKLSKDQKEKWQKFLDYYKEEGKASQKIEKSQSDTAPIQE